jgi:hypothetical protein
MFRMALKPTRVIPPLWLEGDCQEVLEVLVLGTKRGVFLSREIKCYENMGDRRTD